MRTHTCFCGREGDLFNIRGFWLGRVGLPLWILQAVSAIVDCINGQGVRWTSRWTMTARSSGRRERRGYLSVLNLSQDTAAGPSARKLALGRKQRWLAAPVFQKLEQQS